MSLHTRDIATNVFPAPALSVRAAIAGISLTVGTYLILAVPLLSSSFVVPPRHGMTQHDGLPISSPIQKGQLVILQLHIGVRWLRRRADWTNWRRPFYSSYMSTIDKIPDLLVALASTSLILPDIFGK
jgi:hypothetical protein